MFEKRTNEHNCTPQNVERYEEIKQEVERQTRKKIFGSIITFCTGAVVATIAIGRMNKEK